MPEGIERFWFSRYSDVSRGRIPLHLANRIVVERAAGEAVALSQVRCDFAERVVDTGAQPIVGVGVALLHAHAPAFDPAGDQQVVAVQSPLRPASSARAVVSL